MRIRPLIAKIFIIEDIRRGADQFKTDAGIAFVAHGEGFATAQDCLMSFAMGAIVNHLVNPGLRYRLARKEDYAVLARLVTTATLLTRSFVRCCPVRPKLCELPSWVGCHFA